MSIKIVVVGSYNQDLSWICDEFPKTEETIFGKFKMTTGGKGSNQAVAAAKAGCEVHFISKIGTDQYGDMAKKIYKETNVGCKNVFETDKYNTGVAAILIDKQTGDNAISVVPGAAGQLTIEDVNKSENEIKNYSTDSYKIYTQGDFTIYIPKDVGDGDEVINFFPCYPSYTNQIFLANSKSFSK